MSSFAPGTSPQYMAEVNNRFYGANTPSFGGGMQQQGAPFPQYQPSFGGIGSLMGMPGRGFGGGFGGFGGGSSGGGGAGGGW